MKFVFLKSFLDLLKAILADTLSVEEDYIVGICTEDAGRLIFLKNYAIFIGEYFKRVLFGYVHGLSDAYGEHYASQLVYLTYYSC